MATKTVSTTPSSAITFTNVSVAIGGHVILDSVSAHVPFGGATTIIGPNGAGKTTLVKALLGLIPYQGGIFFSKHGVLPRIGYVPQSIRTDGGLPLTVIEFLCLNWQRLPLWFGIRSRYCSQAMKLLEMVGIRELSNRRVCDLSGGELRRALLALALGREPELLVMDEPTSGIDFQGELSFYTLMNELRAKMGYTQLMVCHNLRAVKSHATHVICLNRKVTAEGDPESVLTPGKLTETFLGQGMELDPASQSSDSPEARHA